MANLGFIDGVKREIARMASSRIYLFGMVLVPICVAIFFLSLLSKGLPDRVPTAVVDLDHSSMSRSVTRSLNALQVIEIQKEYESYDEALAGVRSGKVFGFFVIPSNFEREALSGKTPTLEYYSNMTFFVPGTLAFKGFKTVAVATSGGVIKETLISMGIDPERVGDIIQPVVFDQHPLNNPWTNYAIYLCPSFSMCTFVLMILLITVHAITSEIKHGSSPEWLRVAKGRISIAVLSKLLPHTAIFGSVGLFLLWLMFGFSHFPLHGSLGWMIVATLLAVVAAQSFALLICSLVPNPRLAFSVCALFGILAFSFTGFSFPVQNMYGFLAIFSWFAPIRYWFLIYVNEALNGVGLYYSRFYFVALLIYPIVCSAMLWNLKRASLKPVYVP